MSVRCRMDGMMILKGGAAKATVYFDSKDAAKSALDLNENEVVIGLHDLGPETLDEPETIGQVRVSLKKALEETDRLGFLLVEMSRAMERNEPDAVGHDLEKLYSEG